MTRTEEIEIRSFLLGRCPYAVVTYGERDDELSIAAGAADMKLIERMLRSAAYRVRKERRARRRQDRRAARRGRREREAEERRQAMRRHPSVTGGRRG